MTIPSKQETGQKILAGLLFFDDKPVEKVLIDFDEHPLFMFARLLAGSVSRTEDASRTRGGCFWHRISLPYRRSLFFTPNAL